MADRMRKLREDELSPEQRAKIEAFRASRRTPEARAEEKQVRERFQREKPTLGELVGGGSGGPFRHGDVMTFFAAIARLKRQREQRGLTLAQVFERSGLDTGMLSRLENGKIINPTLSTLWRYASAVGARVHLDIETVPVDSEGAPV
jgi:hypothetical protein